MIDLDDRRTLEKDLLHSAELKKKIRGSRTLAENWYAAFCNNEFYLTEDTSVRWTCSWRYAAKILADVHQEGDYFDWFLSGNEGKIVDAVRDDLFSLGWSVIETFNERDEEWQALQPTLMRTGIDLPPVNTARGEFRIGIIGEAGSGKDTLAQALHEEFPSIRAFAFADDLKIMTANMLTETFHRHNITMSYPKYFVEDINEYRDELRGLWQWFGTDLIRAKLPYYWVNRVAMKMRRSLSAGRFVVTDCRFQNERDWLKHNGALIIKVTGRSRGNVPVHASETEVSQLVADLTYENTGTIEDMKDWVRKIVVPALRTVDSASGVLS